MPSNAERFWQKVNTNGECWEWTAGLDHYGYGAFRLWPQDRVVKAHRYAYELVTGAIDSELTVDHLCRNRRCVNPLHMELVTRGENVRRGESAILTVQRKRALTHCKHGHRFDDANTYIRPNGNRDCRTCRRERAMAYAR